MEGYYKTDFAILNGHLANAWKEVNRLMKDENIKKNTLIEESRSVLCSVMDMTGAFELVDDECT